MSTTTISELLDELNGLLDDEFDAIRSRQLEQLTKTVERKTELVKQLNELTGKYCRNGQDLPDAWPELAEQARHCLQRNREVGGAIAVNRALVSGLLDTLCGSTATAPVYGASGTVKTGARSRTVATA